MSNETETDLCLTEMQEADMCVVGAAETCEPCIEQGTFMDIYPIALQSSLQDLMTTGGGSDFCTEQEDSMCSFLQEYGSCCCQEELVSYTSCVYLKQISEGLPEYSSCSASTSCTLKASPSESDLADQEQQKQWMKYGIYASIATAILSLLYYCCCSRHSRTIRRRFEKRKGGNVEVNVQLSGNTTETTNITETSTQQRKSRKRRDSAPVAVRRNSPSTSSDDGSFDWDKYNETFHKRRMDKKEEKAPTPRKKKKKPRKRTVKESMRQARVVLEDVEAPAGKRVHKVFLMPALKEVIDLLEEQKKDLEQKERVMEEERMRLQHDVDQSKVHINSLEYENQVSEFELKRAGIRHSMAYHGSSAALNTLENARAETEELDELHRQKEEMMELLNSLREKQMELGEAQEELGDTIIRSASMPTLHDSNGFLSPQRKFSRIDMTGSFSGLNSGYGDDIEEGHQSWENRMADQYERDQEPERGLYSQSPRSMSQIYFPSYRDYYGYG